MFENFRNNLAHTARDLPKENRGDFVKNAQASDTYKAAKEEHLEQAKKIQMIWMEKLKEIEKRKNEEREKGVRKIVLDLENKALDLEAIGVDVTALKTEIKKIMPENTKEENPFEMIEHGKILAPRYLILPGREEDLEDYSKGWSEQAKHGGHSCIDTNGRNSYFDLGAARRYGKFGENVAVEDTKSALDLVSMMERMRQNPQFIPVKFWPSD